MSLVLVAIEDAEDRGEAGHVARVTVNNPEQRNALGNAGKRELAEAIDAVSADARLRAVVLTGAGDRSFISGANGVGDRRVLRHARRHRQRPLRHAGSVVRHPFR
jgi:enoyl-CoA hydratase/carnithine racemase